eukprot:IDg5645t1
MSQSIGLTIRDYKQCAEMNQTTNEQKNSYLINTLGDPARTFYPNNHKTASLALLKIMSHVDFLSPQCPPKFCSDDFKIAFLREAAIGSPWAIVPIFKIDLSSI